MLKICGASSRNLLADCGLGSHPSSSMEFEEDSRTLPEDEPVRTVGLVLSVSQAGEAPPTPVAEPSRIVDALAKFSEQHGVDFELPAGQHLCRRHSGRRTGRLVREGLLARW